MMTDETNDNQIQPQPPEDEDALTDESAGQPVVDEDDPDLLDPSSRAIDSGVIEDADDSESTEPVTPSAAATEDSEGDADSVPDEPESASGETEQHSSVEWAEELSARRIAVELKRIEVQVRQILEDLDPKRKRKLSGTRRWNDLEEELVDWRFAGRFDEASLVKLRELISRRHYLFRRLRFLAGTRPVWNT